MRIAIIGYGKMGHVIEEISFNRGHSIVCIIDPTAMDAEVSSISGAPIYTPERGFESALFATVEVAIEFSTPATAEQNIANCFAKGVRVVSGTTGWDHAAAKSLYTKAEWGWIWSSNYSLGVNILFGTEYTNLITLMPLNKSIIWDDSKVWDDSIQWLDNKAISQM